MRAYFPISEHDRPASQRFLSSPKNGAEKEGMVINTPLIWDMVSVPRSADHPGQGLDEARKLRR